MTAAQTYSLNELRYLVQNAARGAGIAIGNCEDLGRAAAWLEAMALAGLSAASSCLKCASDNGSMKLQWRRDKHLMRLQPANAGAGCNSVSAATALADLSNSLTNGDANQLTVGRVHQPLISLALLAEQVAHSSLALEFRLVAGEEHFHLVLHGQNVWLTEGTPSQLQCLIHADLTVRPIPMPGPTERDDALLLASAAKSMAAADAGIVPDQASLDALRQLANKRLVKATEESRLHGAGASLTDND